jgi:hypothetical protein
MAQRISSSVSFTENAQRKKLPSYQNIAYQAQSPVWKRLKAIADGSWLEYNQDGTVKYCKDAEKYLIKFEGESIDDYTNRLAQTPYDNKYGQTLEEFTTLSFSGGIEKIKLPFALWHTQEETEESGFAPLWDNIDGHQINGDTFLFGAYRSALRDGHMFIAVDYANIQPATTLAEYQEAADKRRPYWIAIEAEDVVNWREVQIDGRSTLVQVTVRETAIAPDPDADFGEIEVENYRVYNLQGEFENDVMIKAYVHYRLFKPKIDANPNDSTPREFKPDATEFVVIEEGDISIAEIPIYMVHLGTFTKWGESKPSLKAIAEMNLLLYCDESDYNYTHHLCNVPVLTVGSQNGEIIEDIVLSAGKTLPADINANWLTLPTASLSFSRTKILDLETKIGFLKADYLRKPADRQTAFTTSAQLATLDSNLELAARNFCDCIKNVLRATAEFLSESYHGYILLNPQVNQRQGDPNLYAFFNQLRGDSMISTFTLRSLLKEYSFLPESFNVEAESERIAIENEAAASGRAPFSPNPDLMKQVADLALKDVLDKRTSLEILFSAGCLPMNVTVDDVLERSGDTINLEVLGSYLSQPASEDAMQGIGKSLAIDPNRLMAAYAKSVAANDPNSGILWDALTKYLSSTRKMNAPTDKAKPTLDSVFSGDLAPRGAKDDPNSRSDG